MRNLKRALSLALASVMLLGMMVVGAGAASYPDVSSEDNVEAIEVLNAVKVMVGKKGNFDPDAPVNRYEMAVITAKLLLGSEEADKYVVGSNFPFTDVPAAHWAYKYVAACYDYGVISGTSKTTYSGTQSLTATQAALIMMRALGYEDLTKGASDWRAPVVKQANLIQLFKNVVSNPNAKLTRNQVAQLALNTLESDVVITIDNKFEVNAGDVTIDAGQPSYVKVEVKSTDPRYDGVNDLTQQLAEKLYEGRLQKAPDETDYGLPATKWTYPNAATEVGTFATDDAVYVWTEKVEDVTVNDLYKALGTTTLDVYENGADSGSDISVAKGGSAKPLSSYKGATIYAVDTDSPSDGQADRLCVVYPYLAKVTKVTAATDKADRKITMEVWNKGAAGSTTGVTFDTEDFAKDDYVLVYPDMTVANSHGNAASLTGSIIEVKPVEIVSGKITAVSGTQGSAVSALTVDGSKYTVAADALATKGIASGKVVKDSTYSFSSEYDLFLSNGYVIGAEGTSGAKDISNVVYVTAAAYRPVGDFGTETVYRAQVIRMDGTVEILKMAQNAGQDDGKDTANANLAAGFYTITESSGKYAFTPVINTASTDIDNSTNYFGGALINHADYTMKADDKTITVDSIDTSSATSAYLNSNTRILYVKDSLGDLKTSMVLGPVRQTVKDNSMVLLSKDGSNYIVECLIVVGEQASASDQVVYVNNTPKDTLADGVKTYEYYDITTGEKHTVPSKNAPTAGFATYSIDKDGNYTFDTPAAVTNKNADGSHAITQAITLYETWLTQGSSLENIEAKDAVIINNTGNSDNDGLSLKDVADAVTLTGYAYVDDEKVTAIVVNTYLGADARAAKLEVGVAYTVDGGANTYAWAANDTVAFSGTGLTMTFKTSNTGSTWALDGTNAPNGYTATFDGTKLTVTKSAAGVVADDNPFGTITATVSNAAASAAGKTINAACTPNWTDGTNG